MKQTTKIIKIFTVKFIVMVWDCWKDTPSVSCNGLSLEYFCPFGHQIA